MFGRAYPYSPSSGRVNNATPTAHTQITPRLLITSATQMHDFSHRILLREEGRLLRARDRGFESTFLQRRVCEPPVPQLAPGDHVRRLAQFEHEVIGERIRDKIAASKSKGMWMGGVPPFGYRAQDRKLIIVDSEAEIVRFIFRRYAELGSVRLLKDELEARSIRSKLRTSASG